MSTDSRQTQENRDPTSAATSSTGAVIALTALLFVPVTAIEVGPAKYTFVMQWGFLNLSPPLADATASTYPLWTFFAEQPRSFDTLPKSIQAWPLALTLHGLALGSAGLGATAGREDRRVTGGALVLAGIATFWVTLGVAHRFGVGFDAGILTVLPIGAVFTWIVAAGIYQQDIRAIFSPPDR